MTNTVITMGHFLLMCWWVLHHGFTPCLPIFLLYQEAEQIFICIFCCSVPKPIQKFIFLKILSMESAKGLLHLRIILLLFIYLFFLIETCVLKFHFHCNGKFVPLFTNEMIKFLNVVYQGLQKLLFPSSMKWSSFFMWSIKDCRNSFVWPTASVAPSEFSLISSNLTSI